ncbi:hypothetical protein BpJC7_31110 [Weizmannia acidilactici]|uniref:Uncharacterized protein n=1 Tax=Weizmannia acidilactici TaxID=2607726 RepID=A0A5J4JML9_9BACI|nr:hypothetical protein [Weizmannia acidilactici]GER68145.1 hypothetical protein BpJC4_26160 [Weizmannia acidilactici]GER71808.1 hypothetical protein BpJC7_31110 [Weizmannia acidilactici]GER74510.1 hypothetical protein BpPP18_25770 [Weizmannia acidilactici]
MKRRKEHFREEAALEFGDINAGKIYEIMAESAAGRDKKQHRRRK